MNFSHTDFIIGYKVAMLWANACAEQDGQLVHLSDTDLTATIWDFTPEAEAQVQSDCDDFLTPGTIGEIESVLSDTYDSEYAGHDFALTRNHHGAGFWDRGFGETGESLTTWAHSFGEASLFVDADEKVHCE